MIRARISRPLRRVRALLLLLALGCGPSAPDTLEGTEIQKPGVTLQWLSDHDRISPGDSFLLGLRIRHEEGFHTYWRSPGIVGLAPAFDWKLPEGVKPGPIQWPGPELTKMGKLTAWGYEREVLLVSRISVDPDYSAETIPLKADLSWMACAETCHPGWATLSLEIPVGPTRPDVANADLFSRARSELPQPLPESWKFRLSRIARAKGEQTIAHLECPDPLVPKGVVFFCGDNQVNSDLPQFVRQSDTGLEFRFPASEFAPSDAIRFEGVLFHPKGWPGLESRWIRVSAPCPETRLDLQVSPKCRKLPHSPP